MIKYVYITNFQKGYDSKNNSLNEYENKKEYYKNVNNIIYETTTDEYIKLLKNNYKHPKYSLLEIIPENKVNIFFDIDNIPLIDINFIKELIIKLMNFYGFVKYPVITTYKYKSYHLIFPYYTNLMYLNHMVITFLNIYPEYKNIIDSSIYTPYFLFRSVGQYKPNKIGQIRKNKNIHKIIYLHNLSDIDIKKSLIQYTDKSEYYKPGLIIENYRHNINQSYVFNITSNISISYKLLFIISFIINFIFIILMIV